MSLSLPSAPLSRPGTTGRRFRILALDGGGVRGACTAAFLTRLEDGLDAPIARYFDLICGTSTGGILALGLATEHPAAELLELYQARADVLFRRRYPWLPKLAAMAVDSLYLNEGLHAELRDVLGSETTLGSAVTRVCVPAMNVTTGRATVFKTRHMADLERDHLLPMWRVAAATAAAPIYFDPVEIPGCGHYVDGGLWANTPATVGILEAIRLGTSWTRSSCCLWARAPLGSTEEWRQAAGRGSGGAGTTGSRGGAPTW